MSRDEWDTEITISQPILSLWHYWKTLQEQNIHYLSGSSNQYVLILITERAITIAAMLGGQQGTSTDHDQWDTYIIISKPILSLWDYWKTLQ